MPRHPVRTGARGGRPHRAAPHGARPRRSAGDPIEPCPEEVADRLRLEVSVVPRDQGRPGVVARWCTVDVGQPPQRRAGCDRSEVGRRAHPEVHPGRSSGRGVANGAGRSVLRCALHRVGLSRWRCGAGGEVLHESAVFRRCRRIRNCVRNCIRGRKGRANRQPPQDRLCRQRRGVS
jgi:hypothetical protein